MSDAAPSTSPGSEKGQKLLFWACFISLIATAFGFVVRGELLDEWATQFGLDAVQKGKINGAGVWPFAVSIILFSLIIDKIGYGRAMVFAFFAHVAYAIIVICAPMALPGEGATPEQLAQGQATGYALLLLGNVIFALGNGTVEAVINPVVATLFSKEKTKWLNILHAGWPAGLVLTGLMGIALGDIDWRIKVGLIFIPVLIYGVLMLMCKFPINERVAAGGSYREMLEEFGIGGALIVTTLIVMQIGGYFNMPSWSQWLIGGLIVVGFSTYVRTIGRPMFIFLLLIMVPLATTEIGTDGWITNLMAPEMKALGLNALWVIVYTSLIMMILRFFAGPIVHKFSPLGLLAISAILAALGLAFLSYSTGAMILAAATLYGFGKTFFWPTMLGVVSEQYPKGGALMLNATGGVGMLGVGVLGFPLIGLVQEANIEERITQAQVVEYETVSKSDTSIYGDYTAIAPDKVKTLPKETQKKVEAIQNQAKKDALLTMALFPTIMLVCYLVLIGYFKSQGGYHAQELTSEGGAPGGPSDEHYTGGVEGPADA